MSPVLPYRGLEPLLVAGLLLLMLLADEGGFRTGRAWAARTPDGSKSQITTILAATLGLLALLVGFTLSMAAGRFEDRRQLVLAEANAIGTAYLRSRLLPTPEGPELAARLRRYVDVRLDATRRAQDPAGLAEAVRRSESLHGDMWAHLTALAQREPRAVPVGLFVTALNEVIDLHEKRLTAFENRVPDAVLALLALGALGAMWLMGYGSGLHGQRNKSATTVLALLLALVILVIVDLDRPQHGLILVSQESLRRLQAQLAAAPGPAAAPDSFVGLLPHRYRCDDGRDLVATFQPGEPPMARVERDGARWVLTRQPSGSGARYGDGDVTFWEHHGEARLEREGRASTCRAVR